MSWYAFDSGKSIGQRGSENGIIIRDEEHSSGARITLERGGHSAPLAITCGIYGWMVHTRFFGAETRLGCSGAAFAGRARFQQRSVILVVDMAL